LVKITDRFPGARPTQDAQEVIQGGLVDAVAIATPTVTHFDLAAAALEQGLHVFVEKPLARNREQCQELIELAEAKDRVLFVGHVFLHSAPVIKLRELVQSGELGHVYYLSCKRLNLGPIRRDVNSLWDLAPHDISMMLYLLNQDPVAVSCSGLAYLNPSVHDVCNLTLHFPDNKIGIVHVSWLDPRKQRIMTVVGDQKMAVYDDLDLEKIKVYDKGVVPPKDASDFGEFQFSFRHGGMYSPHLAETEPLKAECGDFIRCICENAVPLTDGRNGLQVVKVLEAAEQSLHQGGNIVAVESLSAGRALARV
jgi:predicted dehydrogenase